MLKPGDVVVVDFPGAMGIAFLVDFRYYIKIDIEAEINHLFHRG